MSTKKVLDFIRNGMVVKRYHTLRTLSADTVAHHSHGVAMLCWMLSGKEGVSVNLLMAALVHDLAETETGDAPAPVKRHATLSLPYAALEKSIMTDHGIDFPLTAGEARTLKLADALDGVWFCREEIEFGNLHIRETYRRYLTYIESFAPFSDAEQEIIKWSIRGT